MAVFTEVGFDAAAALIARLGLGRLTELQPIAAGIENTNYFVVSEREGQRLDHVLTVFERLSAEQLPFYLELMRHLARRGLPVPEPQADAEGRILHRLAGKPAAVVDRLRGKSVMAPQPLHCAQLGTLLARMHGAVQDFPLQQPNLRGLAWWEATVPLVRPHLAPEQLALIDAELRFQQALAASADHAALPRGAVHADLFRDNAMFDDGPDGPQTRLSGCFDFYFAGCDSFGFDLAVCLNDWCIDAATGRLDPARSEALLAAYEAVRPLGTEERALLPALLRSAAMRFWVSRLWDYHLPREAHMLTPHDPRHFERVLRERIARPWPAAVAA
ncbi:homoserine kinase [Piscinibacter sp. Jin2]|uniref:Homoserine kinase n=1 Tax=Aquariibacter lacus TaxID=2801332 RepID=A0A9X0XE72_9BURK|nr:homoserine kinase [Piscinibacter lacus]MBL0720254.1 homoserine kinase [Piscinibacter lacus]